MFQLSQSPVIVLLWLTTGVFIVLATLYATKVFRFRDQVVAELKHPVKLNFFPTISISLLLLSIAWMPVNKGASEILWMWGALRSCSFFSPGGPTPFPPPRLLLPRC